MINVSADVTPNLTPDLAEQIAGIGSWRLDLLENTLYWSDQVYKIHGVSPDSYHPELDTAIKFYHPDDRRAVSKYIDQAIESKQGYEFELRIIRADNVIRWIYSKGECQLDSQGSVIALQGIFYDTTRRRLERVQLEERAERYALAINGSQMGIWDWMNIKDNKQWWSPQFYKLLGYENNEIKASLENFTSLIHPEDKEKTLALIHDLLDQKTNFEIIYRLKTKSGEYKWFNSNAVISKNTAGIAKRMVGTLSDVHRTQSNVELLSTITPALDAVTMGIAIFDKAGIYSYLNEAHARMFGYETEELIDKSWELLYREDEQEIIRTQYLPMLSSHGSWNGKVVGKQKNGESLEIEMALTQIENNKIICVCQNITERKRLEQRADAIIDSTPMAMIMVNSEGNIVLVNAETEKLFGYTRDELKGQTIDQLLPEQLRGGHKAQRDSFFQDPKARKMGSGRDLHAVRKDGSEFPVEIGLNPVRTPEGLFVLSAITDITARKRLEQRTEAVIESAPMALIMVNMRGNIVLVNAETEKLFGYDREELKDESIDILLPKPFQEGHTKLRDNFFANPSSRSMGKGRDLFARRKDGSEFPVEIGLNPVKAADELFVLSAITDITERKKIELSQHKINKKLKSAVQELERSNKELDAFAYVASHDLKSPLRAIENLANWIYEDAMELLPEDSKKHLTQLQQRASRMERLLDDLLHYSRAGRMKSEREEINLHNLISEVVETLMIPENVKIEVPRDLPNIVSERAPIYQIFANLISNAIKHNDKENGLIDISWEATDPMITFRISDNGPGIPESYHERIFQLFQTLKPRDEVEGSGMGLAIVQKLLRYHKGTIKVDSTLGEGTTFTFTWPKKTEG